MIIEILVLGIVNQYIFGCSNNINARLGYDEISKLKKEIDQGYEKYLNDVCPNYKSNGKCNGKEYIYSPSTKPQNFEDKKIKKNIKELKQLYNKNNNLSDLITEKKLLFTKKKEYSEKYVERKNGKEGGERWFILYGNIYDLTYWFKIHNHALGGMKHEINLFKKVSGKELAKGECYTFRSHIFAENDYRKKSVLSLLINNRIGEVKGYKDLKLYPSLKGMQDMDGHIYNKDPENIDDDWGDDDWGDDDW
jgi:hypothetical protein